MSSVTDTKQRIPLAEADALAGEIVRTIGPACDRLEVAGSIRRRRSDVGDIELVCVPAMDERRDLLGQVVRAVNRLDATVTALVNDRPEWQLRLDKNGRAAFGPKYKRLRYQGVGVDLFSVIEPAQWGVIYTIRTGPADFSHTLVTSRLFGGWMPAGMFVKDGALYDRGPLVETPTEQSFFDALGLPYLPPEQRTDTVRLAPDRGQGRYWVESAPRERVTV